MIENRIYLHKYAMRFGTYMGIFWILKFALFPLGFRVPICSFLYLLLTLIVPFVGYYYARAYRNKVCEGTISFSHAALFTVFMYMFSSLLAAVAHYIYLEYMDNSFIINTYTQLLNEVATQNASMMENKRMIEDMIDNVSMLSSIEITVQVLSWDIFWGSIISVPTALVVMRKGNSENGNLSVS